MKHENRFKLNMNKETKRAVVVLSIIALLILIVGLVSCSVQLSNSEPLLPPSEQGTDTPIPTQPGGVVVDIDKGGEDMPSTDKTEDSDTAEGSSPSEKPVTKPTKPPIKPTSPVKPTTPPTVPVKPTEPAKPTPPTKPEKPTEKPDRPDGGGSGGGGGSVSYPAAVVEIIAPAYSHTDTEFEVKATLRNVKSIAWTVTETGKDTPQTDFLKGTLTNGSGKITITKQGDYTITAIAKNYGGSTYTFSKTIHIYPTCDITVTADKNAHTDKAFTVKTTLSDNVKQQLNWHIFKDGKEVKWQDTVTGTLTNVGGSIQIREQGSYTLKAVVHDETSGEFFGKADVVVLPVVEISLQAPAAAHTDTMVAVSASTKELGDLNIVWSMTKDGKPVTLSDCTDGKLTNDGGTVRFNEKGSYSLIAAVTDKAGRVISEKANITVYPVAAFSFTLPPTTHTDKTVTVAVKSAELQDMTAEWTVLCNGKVVKPAAVIDGVLTNEGGSIRFKEKDTYTLKSTLFDKLGREYSHEAVIVAYPVAETGFYLPAMTHTDTTIEVKTTFKDTENLTAVWNLTKDSKAISLTDGFVGTLTDKGGKIRFKEVGKYELKATVTDKTGRSFTYTAQTAVYPVITITLELPKETHTDRPVKAAAKVTNGDMIPVRWKIMKGGIDEGVPDVVFAKNDGNMHFTIKGFYSVTATVTDATGRAFSATKYITVYPIPQMAFTLPTAVHTDDILPVDTTLTDMENLTAVWYVDNTFGFQDWDIYIDGTLRNNGGSIRFKRAGVYDLQARVTDAIGRVFRFNSGKVEVLPVLTLTFALPENGYTDTQINVRTRGNNGVLPIEWALIKNGVTIPMEQAISGSLNAQGGKIRFTSDGEYRLTATMFDALGRVFTHSDKISVHPLYNCDFTMPSAIHAGQSFVVAIGANANHGGKNIVWTAAKDGQSIVVADYFKGSLSNSGGTAHIDTVGNYTLTATITDKLGKVFIDTQSISVTNTAPAKPTLTANVTRTYASGKFLVNLTANSTDRDGDTITYVWEGRPSQTATYPLGKNTVRAKAVDSTGAESPWAVIVFFVMDSSGSGGMMLTGPDSTINENGISGATITKYTFTVPPVSGHNSNDYSRVRGYNVKTGQWDQLDYGTTNNGITFTRTLTAGNYSKLEMYYYTNHACMYNKANITYTVDYYFE